MNKKQQYKKGDFNRWHIDMLYFFIIHGENSSFFNLSSINGFPTVLV